MKKDNVIVSLLVVAIVVTMFGIFRKPAENPADQSLGLAVCTVTQTVKTIGHQLSTKILDKGARSWAIIQQPYNATNTVALSFDNASSTLARGYKLYPPISASTTDSVKFGYSTDLPLQNAVEAITSTGSTTITVIECK